MSWAQLPSGRLGRGGGSVDRRISRRLERHESSRAEGWQCRMHALQHLAGWPFVLGGDVFVAGGSCAVTCAAEGAALQMLQAAAHVVCELLARRCVIRELAKLREEERHGGILVGCSEAKRS